MLLYNSPVSGNCYKVRLLLAHLGIPYETLVWVFRILAIVLPLTALVVTHRVCVELQRGDAVKVRQRAALARSP